MSAKNTRNLQLTASQIVQRVMLQRYMQNQLAAWIAEDFPFLNITKPLHPASSSHVMHVSMNGFPNRSKNELWPKLDFACLKKRKLENLCRDCSAAYPGPDAERRQANFMRSTDMNNNIDQQ